MKTIASDYNPALCTIRLEAVREVIRKPWRGRYAAITRAGDSLLRHLRKSCVHSVKTLSTRSVLGKSLTEPAGS